jgi:outer membrane protein insertion porin family
VGQENDHEEYEEETKPAHRDISISDRCTKIEKMTNAEQRNTYTTDSAGVKLTGPLSRFALLVAMILVILSPDTVPADEPGDTGPKQPFVNKIVFIGNEFFSDKDLKKLMYTKEPSFFAIFTKRRLKMDFLQRDVALLETYYHANGFLEAKVRLQEIVTLKKESFVDIVLEISEGEPTRVGSVELRNVSPLKEENLRKGLHLKPGVPFNPSLLESDIYSLKTKYFDEGYLGVVVKNSTAVEGLKVWIVYKIQPGLPISIRRIEIRGNKLTKDSIVRKEITFKEGALFRLSKAIETQRNLFETGLFTEAEIIPEKLNTREQTVDVWAAASSPSGGTGTSSAWEGG